MNVEKWFLASKTFWGIAIMLLTQILGPDGFISIDALEPLLAGIAGTGFTTVGAILALVGRKMADTKLTLFKPSG